MAGENPFEKGSWGWEIWIDARAPLLSEVGLLKAQLIESQILAVQTVEKVKRLVAAEAELVKREFWSAAQANHVEAAESRVEQLRSALEVVFSNCADNDPCRSCARSAQTAFAALAKSGLVDK